MKFVTLIFWIVFIVPLTVCYFDEDNMVPMTTYYTNVTQMGCFQFQNVPYNNRVLIRHTFFNLTPQTLFTFFKGTSSVPDPYYNRIKIQSYHNEVLKFCIVKMRFADAGCYIISISGDVTNITAFVLGRPTTPQIEIRQNGTLHYELGNLSCSSSSISKPAGLNLTYTWRVNNTIINKNEKYSFAGPLDSHLLVNVSRTDIFDTYTCFATEDHGQMSHPSGAIILFPKRPPIVIIKPKQGVYTIIRGEKLTIECYVRDANPDVNSVTMYKDDQVIQEGRSTTFTIYDASADDTACYICTASNGVGKNNTASMSLKVLNMTLPTSSETEFSDTKVHVIAVVTVMCLVLLVACSIAVVLFRQSKFERQSNAKGQQMRLLMSPVERQNSRSDSELGACANPCSMPSHAANCKEHENENARKRNKTDAPQNAEYAQVVKRKVKKNVPTDCVQADVEQIKQTTDRPQKKSNNRNVNDCIQYEERKSKSQLVYSDLDFVPSGDKRFVIREPDNKTNYVDIDFSKHAEPLPDDTSDVSDDGQCCTEAE